MNLERCQILNEVRKQALKSKPTYTIRHRVHVYNHYAECGGLQMVPMRNYVILPIIHLSHFTSPSLVAFILYFSSLFRIYVVFIFACRIHKCL